MSSRGLNFDFRERLSAGVLVSDGAMGTLIGENGVSFKHPYDRANLTHADLVSRLHGEYIRAGARMIETNTFSANRIKLSEYKLGDRVAEINREGARLARRAAEENAVDERVPVLGAVGPMGKPLSPIGSISDDDATEIFREQVEALLEGGVDAILLETFTDLRELRLAFDVVKAFGVPMLAYKTFVEDGETLAAGLPVRVAKEISSWGVDVVGSNCTVGPQRMVGIIEQMSDEIGPVAALPNPGLPQLINGTIHYRRDVGHFTEYGVRLAEAGARLIGGCCGTTPDHIKALSDALRDFDAGGASARQAVRNVSVKERASGEGGASDIFTEKEARPVSEFAQRILDGEFATTVEVDLPRGNDITEVIEASRRLKERGVHAIDISDGARARLRMGPIAVGKIVQEEVGIEIVAHLCCRDRNTIGLQSELLSASALGVMNILAITGDPPLIGDYPEATGVFDTDAIGLVHILSEMNRGRDLAGNSIGRAPGFLIGAAINPTAENLSDEVEKIRRKHEAGAHAYWSQPVFEIDDLNRALDALADADLADIKILLGLMPLRSARQAEFLHHEVPGINIPDRVRRGLAELSPEDAPKFGVEVAQELLVAAKDSVAGAYIMPPASAPDLAGDVVEALGAPAK
ncbi:bifunctional homocysteine S-methyltransferase/methylenetetrahydrofolate reductase [Rubrobacter indicoceani]|uniref:bifunctional homocysteine S-methyltransferase/methylenetetrahydrofolate reductase n=1 Tax=Rubrobacter indicoceani TaxID=2051957 RepID=UPI0013C4F81F|nr:bifunctional homocysteine S-methyltransferase/methylenetetrahydrofolate reductase [Rubrobacter indicoceani]